MDLHQQILSGPRDLRVTLEKARPEIEAMVRRVRWGEGPLFLIGAGPSFCAALAGAYAFEGLVGIPAMARGSGDFEAYSVSVLRQRSLVLALSNSGEEASTLDAARAARARGAVVLAITANPDSTLAQTADIFILLRTTGEAETSLSARLCQQAVVGYMALVTAKILKRHHHHLDVLEDEFSTLPDLVDRIQTHLRDAARTMARELNSISFLSVAGGGYYHPIALHAARLIRGHFQLRAEGMEESEFRPMVFGGDATKPGVLFLSGTHCRVKKRLHAGAHAAQAAGLSVFSVTDPNDRQLQEVSTLSLLIPELTEMAGSTLSLALIHALAEHAGRQSQGEARTRREGA